MTRPSRTTGQTDTYALIGHPVSRSRSPGLHGALFAAEGLDAVYTCFDVAPEAADAAIAAVRTLGIAGANLTVPFKESVLPYLDGLTAAARAAGAVNTLFWLDGRLVGDNTDGAGLLDAVQEARGRWDAPAVVIGAGGSARAVASALQTAGCPRVTVLNRTASRAELVAAAIGCDADALSADAFQRAADGAALVVNCTAGEAAPLIRTLPASALGPGALWVDTNYWMASPPQQDACPTAGVRFLTGHTMLLHQGIRAWTRWTGKVPCTASIKAARAAVGGP